MDNKKGIAIVIAGVTLAAGAALLLSKKAEVSPPVAGYTCPYCNQTFAVFEEMAEHVQLAHTNERIPLEIIWK